MRWKTNLLAIGVLAAALFQIASALFAPDPEQTQRMLPLSAQDSKFIGGRSKFATCAVGLYQDQALLQTPEEQRLETVIRDYSPTDGNSEWHHGLTQPEGVDDPALSYALASECFADTHAEYAHSAAIASDFAEGNYIYFGEIKRFVLFFPRYALFLVVEI